jgi:hypothetical protein
MKKVLVGFVLGIISCLVFKAYATNRVQRLEMLEIISTTLPSDNLDERVETDTPLLVKEKYNLTDEQLLDDILFLTRKYSVSETNEEKRMARDVAVGWIGCYGTTNNLPYLASIMTNSIDYAQHSAICASINLLNKTQLFIPLIRSVVTNNVVYSHGDRQWVYIVSYGMCTKGRSDEYIDDPVLHSRIATFFREQAAVEKDFTLFIDRVACELNPSYRHSHARRDNLAKLRPQGLTGEPAAIYDGRQRDAEGK